MNVHFLLINPDALYGYCQRVCAKLPYTNFSDSQGELNAYNDRMEIKIHEKIADIPADQWNRLVQDNNPFVRHEFLLALENHDCVGTTFGWLPRHIAVYENNHLLAAMILYEKYNSYGEFVFDNAWVDAYQRTGLEYFPKLVSAVPYTPASGQRMLCEAGRQNEVFPILADTALRLAEKIDASTVHFLFSLDDAQEYLQAHQWLYRYDCQYHWKNQEYDVFDDFLAKLSAKKRKNIRQERRKVVDSGVVIRQLNGHTATEQDWTIFADFYNRTFEEKWGTPTLNYGFFVEVAKKLPDQVLLVLADLGTETIAGSLMFRSDTHLYGRHWGAKDYVDSLHFEACYYQGIEYAIAHGLQTFEPGAGGEHKISRGFVPTLTRSSHWVFENGFQQPIANYVEHERSAVVDYIEQQQQRTPYK